MNLYKRAWLFRENTVVFDKGQVKNVTDEEFREVALFEPAIKPKIIEMTRYEDGEPFDNIACGECGCLLIEGMEWEDLLDDEKIRKFVEGTDIEEFRYCMECGVALDWSVEE